MADNLWQTHGSRYVHENNWYKVRQDKVTLPNGKPGEYNVIETRGSVYILPMTDDGKLLFVNLFRYTTQTDSWELPAGHLESEDDNPLVAAKRELREETGAQAKNWLALGDFEVANGIANSIGTGYLASGLSFGNDNEQAEEGIGNVKAYSPGEVRRLIAEHRIKDGPSLTLLMLALCQGKLTL